MKILATFWALLIVLSPTAGQAVPSCVQNLVEEKIRFLIGYKMSVVDRKKLLRAEIDEKAKSMFSFSSPQKYAKQPRERV